MASTTSPIIDLAGVNDLQARIAALESALGSYNAANAVLSAAASVDQALAGTGTSGGTNGGTYAPLTDTIQSGVFSFSMPSVKNNFNTGTLTYTFPVSFTSSPIVVATAQGVDASGYPLMLSTTIGNITPTGFRIRVTNLAGAINEVVNVQYIAITRK